MLHLLTNDPINLDIYICSVSSAHNVAPKGKWLAFISTTAETANPQGELEAAFAKLGTIEKKFVYTQDVFHPKADLAADNVRQNLCNPL